MDLVIINPPRVFTRRPEYKNAKRFVDLSLLVISLPFLIPILMICAAAIYINSGRPIFFVQERIGRGGRPFRIYKFRTLNVMRDDTQNRLYMKAYIRGELHKDKSGHTTYKPITEQQTFRVGRFLRRTSLDELPQLINVLKGEMGIVGPRPNVPWEVAEYRPWHYERLEVTPGLTGLAQVNGRSEISFDTLVRFDIDYIENQSLILDLKIIWKTISTVITSIGAG
jgi:lipopolysaccharide/colanic/teichoic acid biosynthesis glycosyltransferase